MAPEVLNPDAPVRVRRHGRPVDSSTRYPQLTDVRTPGFGADNFAPLTSLDWQVHVYGDATPATRAVCEKRQLMLHEFESRPAMARTGLRRDALYLVRPDSHVALASSEQSVARLQEYLDAWIPSEP